MQNRRWTAIAEDGTHVWLGSEPDPSPEQLAAALVAVEARGAAAWLATVTGDYWFDQQLDIRAVRLLTQRACRAEIAVAGFERRRAAILASVGGSPTPATERRDAPTGVGALLR